LNYDVALLPLNSSLARIVLAGNSRIDFTPDGTGGFAVANDTRFYGARLSNPAIDTCENNVLPGKRES